MEELLIKLSSDHLVLVYLAIIAIAIVEGPILSIVLGALIKLGYFPLALTYVVLMLGDILGDVIWYWIGRIFGYRFVRRFGHYFSITPDRIKKVEDIYHEYKKSILVISKLTTGFGFAVVILFVAGLVKIPFRIYFSLNLLGQFIWTALLVWLGYTFSSLLVTFDSAFARLGTITGFVILIALFLGFSNYVKKRITHSK